MGVVSAGGLQEAAALLRALVGLHLRGWSRSRGPLLWLAFVASWAWYDSTIGVDRALAWWGTWFGLTPVLGFLAGYDTYIRPRENGSIRLLLLHPVPRGLIAFASFLASVIVVSGGLLVFLTYLAVVGRIPGGLEALAVGTVLFAGCLPFVAYSQLGSLLLPRDTAAVVGIIVVVAGFTPFDHWLGQAVPDWIHASLMVLESLLPTMNRVRSALGPSAPGFQLAVDSMLRVAAVLFLIRCLLGRPRLLARTHEP